MYYTYDPKNSIRIPAPFNRAITPIFMGDDDKITDCAFSVHMTEWDPGCTIDVHSHDTQTEASPEPVLPWWTVLNIHLYRIP